MNIKKSGMYGDMPIIKIGKFSISMMTNVKGDERIWVQEGEEEAGEFHETQILELEKAVQEWFNKFF